MSLPPPCTGVSFQHLERLAEGQLGRGAGRVVLGLLAEDEVGLEDVVVGDAGELLDDGLDGRHGVEVLQRGAEALELQRRPRQQVRHALRVVAPLPEHVRRRGVRLARLGDGRGALPEEDLLLGGTLACVDDEMAIHVVGGQGGGIT